MGKLPAIFSDDWSHIFHQNFQTVSGKQDNKVISGAIYLIFFNQNITLDITSEMISTSNFEMGSFSPGDSSSLQIILIIHRKI